MKKLMVDVPDELLEWVQGQEDEARRLLTESAIAQLLRHRQISSGRACELLGLSRWDLPDWQSRFGVSTVDFHPEDLQPL